MSASPTSISAHPTLRRPPNWLILSLVCLGQFMVILDVSVVNVALPAMRLDLGFSQTGLQWVVNAYTLTFAGFLLLGGRAADLFGRKRMFLIGLGLFTGASLVGGLAVNQTILITARAAQGFGGAILSPATLTILITTFSNPRDRARALGIWSVVAAGGGAAGALVGGILTDLLSWRWILFINLPIGIAVAAVAWYVLPETRVAQRTARLDIFGALTITGALITLVYAIVSTDSGSWSSWQTVTGLPLAGILFIAFVWIELHVEAPLVSFGLFRSRSLVGANLVMMLLSAASFAMWFFLSLYLQNVLGYSALKAGVAFVPQPLAIMVGAQISSRIVHRIGARALLVIGPTVSAVGLIWLAQVNAGSAYFPTIVFPSVLITLGMGLSFTPITLAATTGVRREDAGLASGVVNTTRQIGGSVGLAILATLASDHTRSYLTGTHATHAMVLQALTAGFTRAFAIGAVFAIVAAGAALIIPPIRAAVVPAAEPVPASAAEGPRLAAGGNR